MMMQASNKFPQCRIRRQSNIRRAIHTPIYDTALPRSVYHHELQVRQLISTQGSPVTWKNVSEFTRLIMISIKLCEIETYVHHN